MPALRKPKAIRPGAVIGIAAPAGPIEAPLLERGEAMLRRLGFEPRRGGDVLARRGYLAGDDERRANELMTLVEDPAIDAIVCARGGYGCHRIISRLDPARFRAAAKPVVGYSDITTLLLWMRRHAGLMGFHGPMLERGDDLPAEACESLVRALTGAGAPPRLAGKSAAGGWAEGRLVGGSLSLLVASLRTPWELDTRGAILLFEDTYEAPYRIDRMLQQLSASGKLSDLVGVGVGSLTECENARCPEPSAEEVVREVLEPLGVPVVTDLPFGHGITNLTWPFGARAAIDGERGEIELLESGVVAR